MSRHTIPNAPGSPDGRQTVAGWDAPLATFFAYASDRYHIGHPQCGDDYEVWAVGETPGEITSIPDLALKLAEHGVELPVDTAAKLADDFAREGDRSQGRPASRLIAALADAVKGGDQ